jgi:adenosylhomocysteinase
MIQPPARPGNAVVSASLRGDYFSMNEEDTNMSWVKRNMPLTRAAVEALPDLHGVRLACSVHLEPKVAPAIGDMLARGAAVFLTTCNPATVRNDVVSLLSDAGAQGRAWKGMGAAEEAEAARRALAWGPTHLWEMGATLATAIAGGGGGAPVAGMECTGSGIARLRALATAHRFPPFPVFNCDEVPIKEGLHNRYLVGQSAWQAFTERTQLSLHRKRVLVVGCGPVGMGVAITARSLGGTVSVAERDPARALQARYEGFPAGALEEMLPSADVVVTATGARGVLAARHLPLLPDGCILMNVGHAADEIEVPALGALREVIPFVAEARVGSRTVFLFAGGSMANLTAGQGDTLNSFDITMAAMLAGLRFVFSADARGYPVGLHALPRAAWEPVAAAAAAQ